MCEYGHQWWYPGELGGRRLGWWEHLFGGWKFASQFWRIISSALQTQIEIKTRVDFPTQIEIKTHVDFQTRVEIKTRVEFDLLQKRH